MKDKHTEMLVWIDKINTLNNEIIALEVRINHNSQAWNDIQALKLQDQEELRGLVKE